MNKLYLIFLLTCITSFSYSQEQGKIGDVSTVSDVVRVKELRFYPNPASSVINFEFLKPVQQRDLTLQIYNFIGKKVYESTSISIKTTVPLTEFFRGVYIFQLRDKSGRIIESGKFQVSK